MFLHQFSPPSTHSTFIFKLPPVLEDILCKRSSRGQAILLPAWPELQCWLKNHFRQVSPGHHIWQRHCSHPSWAYMGKKKPSTFKKKPKSTSSFSPINRWIYPGSDFMQQPMPTSFNTSPQSLVLRVPRMLQACLHWQDLGVCPSRLWGCGSGMGSPRDKRKCCGFVLASEGHKQQLLIWLGGLHTGGKRVTLWERWQTGLATTVGHMVSKSIQTDRRDFNVPHSEMPSTRCFNEEGARTKPEGLPGPARHQSNYRMVMGTTAPSVQEMTTVLRGCTLQN